MASSSFYFFLIILILIKYADTTTQTPPPTYPPPPPQKQQPFKPGISVVIGVLTSMFSLTFLLLLYIKHCNTITSSTTQPTTTTTTPPLTAPRKNSGIDRTVIQSLPIFRFGSLMGQKDGLDCAVCLTRFEPAELLRLLPKCKHAFHVECVDTWLDAHSTCPLCRHHVDPEDILLLQPQHTKNNQPQIEEEEQQQQQHFLEEDLENGRRKSSSQQIAETRRVSGRHSSVEGGMILRVMKTASFRRSLDSAVGGRKKKENGVVGFGRSRKDGMLLVNERRLEHRIIVSPCLKAQDDERWSDVQPSDWLYLMSEMIIRREQNNNEEGGRGIINSRSVSELTGLSREGVRQHQRQREEGLVSRWLAWISISKPQSHTHPPVR